MSILVIIIASQGRQQVVVLFDTEHPNISDGG
jgi:hypothetical protein